MSEIMYKYPVDKSDRGILINSSREEEVWDRMERMVFQRGVLPLFKDIGKQNRLMDIGAGVGTYSLLLSPYFDEIITIEPDHSRIEKLKEALSAKNAQVVPIECFAQHVTFPDASVDTILLIHLLQHITEKSEDDILNKAVNWLRNGGFLVLCFSMENSLYKGCFISWKNQRGESILSSVPETLFDLIVETNPPGILPVRKVNVERIKKKLTLRGLEVIFEDEYIYEPSNTLLASFSKILGRIPWLTSYLNEIPKKIGLRNGYIDYFIVVKKLPTSGRA